MLQRVRNIFRNRGSGNIPPNNGRFRRRIPLPSNNNQNNENNQNDNYFDDTYSDDNYSDDILPGFESLLYEQYGTSLNFEERNEEIIQRIREENELRNISDQIERERIRTQNIQRQVNNYQEIYNQIQNQNNNHNSRLIRTLIKVKESQLPEGEECGVCYSSEFTKVNKLYCCKKYLCFNCTDSWFFDLHKNTCPYCRAVLIRKCINPPQRT